MKRTIDIFRNDIIDGVTRIIGPNNLLVVGALFPTLKDVNAFIRSQPDPDRHALPTANSAQKASYKLAQWGSKVGVRVSEWAREL